VKIQQILDKIDDNQLFVPAFQREYVWKRENAKELIVSLMNEYPTGTILTWDTNKPPELKGKHKYNPVQGAIKIILDGQQRITTLYMLIRSELPPYYEPKEITVDPRGLYLNVETRELQYYKKLLMENNPHWVNVTDIFQRKIRERDVIDNVKKVRSELTRDKEDIISINFRAVENIPSLEFVEQSIPIRARLKEAIDIFYRVNDSGVNLTDAELALAQISGYWPEARATFKKKLEELKNQGFDFKLDFIIYCLLGVLYHLGSDMRRLHEESNNENIRDAWSRLDREVLDYVINILRSQAYVDHSKEINSVYALVPMVVFVFQRTVTNITQSDIQKMIKWFYYSQIRQRYASQLPQKLDKDVGIVARSDNPFDELIGIIRLERTLEISPEEFIGVDIRNALYSLMRWYFKSRNAVCLTTGISLRKNMGKEYSLEWDHIFPYSILRANGYNTNNRYKYSLAQEITNRAVLTKVENRKKSNKLAEHYLTHVKERFPKSLELQCIPDNPELWKLEHFERFLEKRRELLAHHLNDFLNALDRTEEIDGMVTIDERILEGESNELEFKSTLRWNLDTDHVDKRLEEVIMKAIAAFANAEGGSLLIGVSDEGTVIGLAHDYASLHGDRDEFQLHLNTLMCNNFDRVFVSTCTRVKFHGTTEGFDICEVEIDKSPKPLFVDSIDKNGQKTGKFYVRTGNSSREFNIKEAGEYIKSRF
jgi:uncharacterized protein with ParB-like and HNH nuclease domain